MIKVTVNLSEAKPLYHDLDRIVAQIESYTIVMDCTCKKGITYCEECGGNGVLADPAGEGNDYTCPECRGINSRTIRCKKCDGKGKRDLTKDYSLSKSSIEFFESPSSA